MIDEKDKLIEKINSYIHKEIEASALVMAQELEKSANNDDLQVKIIDTYFLSIKEDIENKKITIDDILYSINTYNAFVPKIYIYILKRKENFIPIKKLKHF